jgi:hypothetical protein
MKVKVKCEHEDIEVIEVDCGGFMLCGGNCMYQLITVQCGCGAIGKYLKNDCHCMNNIVWEE